MERDLLGNLTEWGRVADFLEQMRRDRNLDEHQAGMARILRYRGNWRLTEQVLWLALQVTQANDLLTAEVINLLADPRSDWETRLLAARAAGHLLTHRPPQAGPAGFDPERAVGAMQDLSGRVGEPALQQAIREAVVQIRQNAGNSLGRVGRGGSY